MALLATPWDFHAERARQARMLAAIAEYFAFLSDAHGSVPVDVIQGLFFTLAPFTAERKFTRFSALDPEGEEARAFVAVEDWLNDGVPLAPRVARDCARSWYGDNEPGRGLWRVGGERVDPELLHRPALVVVPRRDRPAPAARSCRHDGRRTRPFDAVDPDRRMAEGAAQRAMIFCFLLIIFARRNRNYKNG